MCTALELSFL